VIEPSACRSSRLALCLSSRLLGCWMIKRKPPDVARAFIADRRSRPRRIRLRESCIMSYQKGTSRHFAIDSILPERVR
jgi:hypothetical protein